MYTSDEDDDDGSQTVQSPVTPQPREEKRSEPVSTAVQPMNVEAISTALGKMTTAATVKKPAPAAASRATGGFGGGRKGKTTEKPESRMEISRRPLTMEELQVIGMARDPTR